MSRFKSDSGRCIPVNENAFKFRDKWLKESFPIRWKKEHEPDAESIHINKAAEKGFEVGYFEAKNHITGFLIMTLHWHIMSQTANL